ncbi:MAG TPA: ABC transporter permease, partial [Prolixibacteraceae bacterium]|nr:ABC transporter permease [Prolixibacteraceae bacterium]
MISFHNIFSIAKYERKTLLRSWFFRIFGILSLLVLFGMNFGLIIEGGGDEGWALRSIPSAIPYFNLLVLNVAQAIIAVFLASDFLKRDKKLDTTEVIYMRSMTNGEYVIGKTWGNLQVFLMLNIAVLLMAFIFNLLAKNTTVDWLAYPVYLLLISVPTLVFIMGLSFLLMSVIRNQAITFVLILGYIGITLFILEAKYYYIFDYMSFNIPMLSSDIVGFGNLEAVLIHRGIYFFLGLAFIFLTIFLLKRLPQSGIMTYFSLILGIVLTAGGSFLAYSHLNDFRQTEKLRETFVSLNNKYVNEPIATVSRHTINLEHQGERIESASTLSIKNENQQPLTQLIFNLNDGLLVSGILVNGQDVAFTREHHLLFVDEGILLQPQEEASVEINYSGKINESLAYLDIDEEERLERYGKFALNVDKRYAFIKPEYVLLTNESGWYPKTGVTFSPENVSWYHSQFTRFNLNVKTKPGLQAVSQGEIDTLAQGEFAFQTKYPLTQLSLAIGNYKYKSFEKDSISFGVWYIKGHDFFSEGLPEIKDTIPDLIAGRLNDLERNYNLSYVFKRFNLVEVPAQFKTYERIWTSNQEMVQPEQIFIPEKAYLMRSADFEGMKKRMERWGRGNDNMNPQDKEIRVLNELMESFTEEQVTDWQGGRTGPDVVQLANPYFIFPMLYSFQNNIQSDKWPITNRIFEAYLKSQVTDFRAGWMRNISGMSEDEKAN